MSEAVQAEIRVFVVDDHPLVRSGVKSELEGRVDVVGTAGDVDEAFTGIYAVFSPRLAGFVLDAFAGSLPLPSDPELDQLTARERDVLRLIARGYAYKEVARRLNLSVKTVETHVSSVLRKLQLSSRHELTRWATERRLV
jgi:DNA-binding NarL/FixJ family response regulator